MPRAKSFWNEMRKGFIWALGYPRNVKELIWTFVLFGARLYIGAVYFLIQDYLRGITRMLGRE